MAKDSKKQGPEQQQDYNKNNKLSSKSGVLDNTHSQLTEQIQLPLIEHQENNVLIAQRAYDGYINATAMCIASGKKLSSYLRLEQTKEFIDELSLVTKLPFCELIQVIKGGRSQLQGTWVHPQVAINLGQWASAKFAVLVSRWVIEWMSGGVRQQSSLPWHVRRYLINREKIPVTHFSMLDQMTLRLLAPFEARGYILPDSLMPDISLGKIFSGWLRKNGYDPDSFPTYTHSFGDANRKSVKARLYPNELITVFNIEINSWIKDPKKALKYFEERDQSALSALKNIILSLPAPEESKELV